MRKMQAFKSAGVVWRGKFVYPAEMTCGPGQKIMQLNQERGIYPVG
jgi:hypothetical protein